MSASDEQLLSSTETGLVKPEDRLTSSKGNIYMDRRACLNDTSSLSLSLSLIHTHFITVAVGKMRVVINRVVGMSDGERKKGKVHVL